MNLEMGVAMFQDLNPERVISISHNDGDGLACSALIKKTMDRLGILCTQIIFNRSMPWGEYFAKKIDLSRLSGGAILISDLGAEEREICEFFNSKDDIHVFILDHHKIKEDQEVNEYPDNVFSFNATRFDLDGLSQIAGSTLTFLFCQRLTGSVDKLAWLPVVGMAGDVLKPANEYKDYNRYVFELGLDEGIVGCYEGIALQGGMAEKSITESLKYSLIPYMSKIKGDHDAALQIVRKCGIDPHKNVLSLTSDEINALEDELGVKIKGDTALVMNKQGLLHFAFEFNFYISLVGDENYKMGLNVLDKVKLSKNEVAHYKQYMDKLIPKLGDVSGYRKKSDDAFTLIEVFDDDAKQLISDIASYSSVNFLTPDDKILLVAGKFNDEKIKLSLRCSRKFVNKNKFGANALIDALTGVFGGRGGGHDLAGGWLISKEKYERFKQNKAEINRILSNLKSRA